MNKTRNRRAAGFTLLEVMLVMLILTMLAGGAIVGYVKVQAKAEQDNTQITVDRVEEAVNHYRLTVGTFPDEDEGLNLLITPPSDETRAERWKDRGPFVTGGKLPKDAWGNDLIYKRTDEDEGDTTGVYFRVYSPGPNGEDDSGTGDDIPAWAEEE
ncbi:MAG: type II secretion system major pseudopilin GspG [Planctomycetota bacterium]